MATSSSPGPEDGHQVVDENLYLGAAGILAAIRSFSRFSSSRTRRSSTRPSVIRQRGAAGRQERRLGVRVMHRHAEDEPALAEIGGIWTVY